MTTHKITLHSELGRDDLHMELLELHERLKLYGVCVVMEDAEAEMKRAISCHGCKWIQRMGDEEPCKSCKDYKNWEAEG